MFVLSTAPGTHLTMTEITRQRAMCRSMRRSHDVLFVSSLRFGHFHHRTTTYSKGRDTTHASRTRTQETRVQEGREIVRVPSHVLTVWTVTPSLVHTIPCSFATPETEQLVLSRLVIDRMHNNIFSLFDACDRTRTTGLQVKLWKHRMGFGEKKMAPRVWWLCEMDVNFRLRRCGGWDFPRFPALTLLHLLPFLKDPSLLSDSQIH